MDLDPRRTYGPPERATRRTGRTRSTGVSSFFDDEDGYVPQRSAQEQAKDVRANEARYRAEQQAIRQRDALTRLNRIQEGWQNFPGRQPNGTGPTGLLPGDAHGYSDMLNEQTEALNLQRSIEGKGPMNVEAVYPGGEDQGVSATVQARAMKALEDAADQGIDPDDPEVDRVLQGLWGRDNAYDQAVQRRSRERLRDRYGARRG